MFNWFKSKSSLKTINKNAIEKEISQNNKSGICTNNNIIVSLTSFPQRMHDIHFCLYSLLTQSIKPSKVILWLAEDQFPNREKNLPLRVLNLQKIGLTIKWCENLYSYKKLIPALKEFPNNIIVTADDDIYYEKDWLAKLYNGYLSNPDCIVCHRAHCIKLKNGNILPYKKWQKKIKGESISFSNFFTGAGGVLYPANSLYKDILNTGLFTQLAPKADDIWFWSMALLNNYKIKIVKDNISELTYINPERERGLTNELTLFSTNKKGGNDIQLEKVISHYPQIKEILSSIVYNSVLQ